MYWFDWPLAAINAEWRINELTRWSNADQRTIGELIKQVEIAKQEAGPITRRDLFAGLAMAGMWASPLTPMAGDGTASIKEMARAATLQADALVARLGEGEDDGRD